MLLFSMKATCSRLFWSPNWVLIDLVVCLRGSLQPRLYFDSEICFLQRKFSDEITTSTLEYGLYKDIVDCSFVHAGVTCGHVSSCRRFVSVVCFLSKIAVSNGLTRAGAFGSLTKTLCWTVWIFTKSKIMVACQESDLVYCRSRTLAPQVCSSNDWN